MDDPKYVAITSTDDAGKGNLDLLPDARRHLEALVPKAGRELILVNLHSGAPSAETSFHLALPDVVARDLIDVLESALSGEGGYQQHRIGFLGEFK